jgi:hypothetical protein
MTFSLASLGGADLAQAAVSSAKSLLDMLDQRSPGARTEGELTKTKHAKEALADRETAVIPKNLAEVLAPPVPALVPVDIDTAAPIAQLASALPPGIILAPPPPPGIIVTPPGGGVITSWRAGGLDGDRNLALRVFTGDPTGTSFTPVAESPTETFPGGMNQSFPTRISVSGGELLGIDIPAGPNVNGCVYVGAGSGNTWSSADSVMPVGQTETHTAIPDGRLNVSAVLEPDADHDGFGDETQDQCPTDASIQGACPVTPVTPAPPVTTVKKKKCKKHNKKHHSASSAKKKNCKKTKKH